MNPAEQNAAFERAVKLAAHERGAIQDDTAREVVRLMNLAADQVRQAIEGQPSDFLAWYLPQLRKQIEQTLAVLSEESGIAATAGQAQAWEAGQALIDQPLAAASVPIAAELPRIDTGQLLAMRFSACLPTVGWA